VTDKTIKIKCLLSLLIILFITDISDGKQNAGLYDFSSAQIVITDTLSDTEKAALEMLIEEIWARTAL
jgi:hypothetical protein